MSLLHALDVATSWEVTTYLVWLDRHGDLRRSKPVTKRRLYNARRENNWIWLKQEDATRFGMPITLLENAVWNDVGQNWWVAAPLPRPQPDGLIGVVTHWFCP